MGKTCNMTELLSALTSNLDAQDVLSADITSSIANAITKRRMALDMNQKQVAELFGKSQGTISKWENGDLNYSIDLLAEIAVKLGLELTVKLTPRETVTNNGKYRSITSKVVSFPKVRSASYISDGFELKEM